MHILDGPRCSTSVRNDKGVSFLRVTTASMLPPVCHPSSLPCVTIAPPSKTRNVRSKIAHSPSPPPEKKVELFCPLTLTKYSLFFSLSLSLSLSLRAASVCRGSHNRIRRSLCTIVGRYRSILPRVYAKLGTLFYTLQWYNVFYEIRT